MSYKTILVHVNEAPQSVARYHLAAHIAMLGKGHLTGLATTGLSRYYRQTVAMDFASPEIAPYIEGMRKRAQDALAHFGTVVGALVIDQPTRRLVDDEAEDSLSALARYCDLCVVSHYKHHDLPPGERPNMAADITAASGCPVLLVPGAWTAVAPFRHVVLAWNASRESARAMHAAMPFLQGAAVVDIAIFDDARHPPNADIQPAATIREALARHGVAAEVIERQSTGDISGALMGVAKERGADLLVMGCYGHSRVRERLLGGVTKGVLAAMELPVLMSA